MYILNIGYLYEIYMNFKGESYYGIFLKREIIFDFFFLKLLVNKY